MTPFLPAPLAGQAKVCPSRSRGARPSYGAARLRGDRDEVAQRAEPGERLALELADALPRQVELVPDRLERPRLALEAEPKLEDAPLPLGEGVERTPHALPAERLLGLDEAALLGALDERARLLGVEQLVQLVRRQLASLTLSTYDVGGG